MRILLAATRRIHTIAVSLHIAALRVGVWFDDRKINAAMAVSDAAEFAVDVARAALKEAQNAAADAMNLELGTIRANRAYRAAAVEEASSLRRGVFL